MSYLDDGFSTVVSFADAPNILFKQKSVTPPSISGGGGKNLTHMENVAWRTFGPKRLKQMGDMALSVSYDPGVYADIIANVQVNQLLTVTFPDGSTVKFWGWLEEFNPGVLEEGTEGTATVTIMASLRNAAGLEVAPVYAAAA